MNKIETASAAARGKLIDIILCSGLKEHPLFKDKRYFPNKIEWLSDTKNIGSRLNWKFVFLSLSYCTQQRQILSGGIHWHQNILCSLCPLKNSCVFLAGQLMKIHETFDQIKVKIVPF